MSLSKDSNDVVKSSLSKPVIFPERLQILTFVLFRESLIPVLLGFLLGLILGLLLGLLFLLLAIVVIIIVL